MALVRGNLSGTKDGSNLSFTIPVTLISGSEQIIFNTSILYPVASSPKATECIISGVNVTLGLAPAATDNLWYYGDIPSL